MNASSAPDGRRSLPQLARWLLVALELAFYSLTSVGLAHVLPHSGFLDESMFRAPGSARFVNETPRWLAATMGAHLLLFVCVRLGFGWRGKELGIAKPLSAWRENALLTGMGLVVVNLGLLLVPGVTDAAWDAYFIRTREDLFVYLVWFAPVVAALGEELIFRAFLQGRAMEAHPAWGAVASAMTFALLHRFQGPVALFAMHVPSALLFSVVYAKKRDLLSQIVGHALFDVIVFGELWLVHAEGVGKGALCGGLALAAIALVVALRKSASALAHDVTAWAAELRADARSGLYVLAFVPFALWMLETEMRWIR